MSKLTWRQLLVYTAYFFAALTIVGIAYTLYQWIQNPDEGQWEPLNVLADNAFSLFSAAASFVALRSSRRAPDKPVTFFSSPPETLGEANWQRYRENTLRNVESAWINGYLKNAVHKSVEIELGLTYQPEAVSRTWGITLKRPGQENEPIPANKSIYRIFEENGRSLLILGEPASGKTITMLHLAEILIHKAQKDKTEPIPLVLNLSSWGAARQPLAEWLVEEIFLQYQVARGLTRSWLEHGHVLLLLDGLDEVAKAYRDDCIQAINEFKAHYAIEVVVCSRVQDYEQLQQQLNLPNAILIQPLTVGEMDRYLTELGSSTCSIRAALADDKELQELARSPLLLSLMPIAYEGLERLEIITSTYPETNRRRLLDIYIGRMFERRQSPAITDYTSDHALQWLANLAKGMNRHKQSIFHIERLQPSWLPSAHLRQRYRILEQLGFVLYFGLGFGLVLGLGFGLVGGLGFGLVGGLGFGLYFGLLFGLGDRKRIEPAEKLSWIWPERKQFIENVKLGLILGLIFGTIGGWPFMVLMWLSFGFIDIVLESIKVSKPPPRMVPNQGIRNSGRNALMMTLVVSLVVSLVVGVSFGLYIGVSFGLYMGLSFGLIAGLYMGLRFGGAAIIQHYTLRLLLSQQNIIPFARDKALIDYLDKMAELILLRRVGGGWVFIHRYLLEHFASLQEASTEDNMTNL